LIKLMSHEDPTLRAWAVRTVGNFDANAETWTKARALATDVSPDVQLQVAIAAGANQVDKAIPTLLHVLENCGEDKLIPQIVWQNLHPLLEEQSESFAAALKQPNLASSKNVLAMYPRIIDRLLASKNPAHSALLANLLSMTLSRDAKMMQPAAKATLQTLTQRIQSREIQGERLEEIARLLEPTLVDAVPSSRHPLHWEACLIAANWKNPLALRYLYEHAMDQSENEVVREQAINALAAVSDKSMLELAQYRLAEKSEKSERIRGAIITSLAKIDSDEVAAIVIDKYSVLPENQRPRAIELLTQRANWGKALLNAVAEKNIPANMINVNQAQKLNSLGDKDLTALLTKNWGTVRTGRDPGRQKVIDDMRALLEKTPGDPARGQLVYNKVCGQCHKLHGNGQEVGPDITANGRSNFDQLLSNVFDPSLVIGASYQARTVLTTDGRVITGLLAEDTPQRIVLKVQGGKLETIARGDIEELKVSELSLMPEQLEKQLKPEELADLFSLLTLDKAPSDKEAKRIPGAPSPKK
jgi:putative heme-binding domain-containing protein